MREVTSFFDRLRRGIGVRCSTAAQHLILMLARPSLLVAAFLGIGGLGLAGSNLIFAARLDVADFGRLALFQAFLSLMIGLAPLGLDSLVVRGELRDYRTAWRTALTVAVLPGFAGGVLMWLGYGLNSRVSLLLVIGAVAAAVSRICSAFDQAALRFWRAQLISQLPYLLFALSALILWTLRASEWTVAALSLVAGHCCAAVVGLTIQRGSVPPSDARPFKESLKQLRSHVPTALAFVGISISIAILSQVERLVIPQVLSLEALATYGVAATIIGSPYRILQASAGYALMPRLRDTTHPVAARALIVRELRFLWVSGVLGGTVLLAVTDRLTRMLYGNKFHIPFAVTLMLIGAGLVWLTYGVASAAMGALGTPRQLGAFNRVGWLSVIIAVLAAFSLARFGIAGVIAGATLGWIVRILNAYGMLRRSFTVRTTAVVSELEGAPSPSHD